MFTLTTNGARHQGKDHALPLDGLPEQAWAALAVMVSALIGSVSSVILERIRANKHLDSVVEDRRAHLTKIEDTLTAQIEEVRKLAKPTGNGFADEMRRGLADNAAALSALSERVAMMDSRIWEIVSRKPDR
jgi:hypothetical protein